MLKIELFGFVAYWDSLTEKWFCEDKEMEEYIQFHYDAFIKEEISVGDSFRINGVPGRVFDLMKEHYGEAVELLKIIPPPPPPEKPGVWV